MNKTIDTRHYSRKAAFECMQIFFRVVHFLQDTCGSFIYTKLRTRWQQTNSASLCVINFFLPEQVIFFTRRLSRSECVVFICATSTGRSKHKQTLIAKKNVFYETCLTYNNFNLRSVNLSLSAEIWGFSQLYRTEWIHMQVEHITRESVKFELCFHTCRWMKFFEKMWLFEQYLLQIIALHSNDKMGSNHKQIGQFVTRDLEISYAKTKIFLSQHGTTNLTGQEIQWILVLNTLSRKKKLISMVAFNSSLKISLKILQKE